MPSSSLCHLLIACLHLRVKGTEQRLHPRKALDLQRGLSLGAVDWREQHYRASRENTPTRLVVGGWDAAHAFNQWPMRGSTSHSRNTDAQRPRCGDGSGSSTVILNSLMEKFLLSIPSSWCSVSLESLVPRGGIFPPGNTDVVSLNWKILLVILSFEGC